MDNRIIVTVALTVYKRTEYLEAALQSVLTQTMPDFEVIIADDSGSRNAEAIYQRYAADQRIIYHPNSCTKGIVLSLKEVIQHSRGAFIAVLNDDDYWEPSFLEKLVQPLRESRNRVLAFSDHWVVDFSGKVDVIATEENTKLYQRSFMASGDINNPSEMTLIYNGIPLAMAAVFRKDALNIDLLVTDVVGAYDFWISCLLAATKRPFYYVSERLTNYRIHPQMETGRRSTDKQLNNIFIHEKLIELQLFPEYTDYLIKRQSFYFYKAGKDNLYFEQFDIARSYFRKAIKIKWDYRYLILLVISYIPNVFLKKTYFIKK